MDYDLIIIGSGPAGMAAGIYAGRSEMKTLLLEKMMVGGQVSQTMDIANYPGFPDSIDGPSLADRMQKQAEKFGVEFKQAEAKALVKDGSGFAVTINRDEVIKAKTVILSTGSDPRKLGVPGDVMWGGDWLNPALNIRPGDPMQGLTIPRPIY